MTRQGTKEKRHSFCPGCKSQGSDVDMNEAQVVELRAFCLVVAKESVN
jgi:hypothetical protein